MKPVKIVPLASASPIEKVSRDKQHWEGNIRRARAELDTVEDQIRLARQREELCVPGAREERTKLLHRAAILDREIATATACVKDCRRRLASLRKSGTGPVRFR